MCRRGTQKAGSAWLLDVSSSRSRCRRGGRDAFVAAACGSSSSGGGIAPAAPLRRPRPRAAAAPRAAATSCRRRQLHREPDSSPTSTSTCSRSAATTRRKTFASSRGLLPELVEKGKIAGRPGVRRDPDRLRQRRPANGAERRRARPRATSARRITNLKAELPASLAVLNPAAGDRPATPSRSPDVVRDRQQHHDAVGAGDLLKTTR